MKVSKNVAGHLILSALVFMAFGCGKEKKKDATNRASEDAVVKSGPFGFDMNVRYDEDTKELSFAGFTCHGGNCAMVRPDVTISADGVQIPRDGAANYFATLTDVAPKNPWAMKITASGTDAPDQSLILDMRRAVLKGQPEWNAAGSLIVHWQGDPFVAGEAIELFVTKTDGKAIYAGSLDSETRAVLRGDSLEVTKQFTAPFAEGDYFVYFARSHAVKSADKWSDAPRYAVASAFGRYYSAPEPIHIPAKP